MPSDVPEELMFCTNDFPGYGLMEAMITSELLLLCRVTVAVDEHFGARVRVIFVESLLRIQNVATEAVLNGLVQRIHLRQRRQQEIRLQRLKVFSLGFFRLSWDGIFLFCGRVNHY